MAGEYGSRRGRPHYHALIFNYDFPDRQFLRYSPAGERLFTSALLSKVWGFGYSSIGDVTFGSAAYVARYCVKKITGVGKDEVDVETGLKPYERLDVYSGVVSDVRSEYVTMSRRPGIGRLWYEKFKSICVS